MLNWETGESVHFYTAGYKKESVAAPQCCTGLSSVRNKTWSPFLGLLHAFKECLKSPNYTHLF